MQGFIVLSLTGVKINQLAKNVTLREHETLTTNFGLMSGLSCKYTNLEDLKTKSCMKYGVIRMM